LKTRLLQTLEKLALSKKVCIKELAKEYNSSIRTIQNDFKAIKEYFSDKLLKKGDCYYFLDQTHFSNLFKSDPKTTKQFLKLVFIIDSALYDKFTTAEYQDILQALKVTSSTIYQIENSPYENLKTKHKEIIEKLEDAITNKKYLNISYQYKNGSILYSHSIPIKILYLNENWYLVVLTTNHLINNSAFKQLRVSSIISVKFPTIEPKTFDKDNTQKIKAERFIKKIQTAYSNMDKPTYTVLVEISANVARFFKKKKYLKSQRVIEELENGDILVSYEICNDMEIIPIIQRWIPFMRVIKPLRIRERVEKNIEKFMNRD